MSDEELRIEFHKMCKYIDTLSKQVFWSFIFLLVMCFLILLVLCSDK